MGLTDEEVELFKNYDNLSKELANAMIKNVIDGMTYPFAIATNFRINGKNYLVPIVIKGSSVVVTTNHAAKMLREEDSIIAKVSDSIMIGQMHLVKVDSPHIKSH